MPAVDCHQAGDPFRVVCRRLPCGFGVGAVADKYGTLHSKRIQDADDILDGGGPMRCDDDGSDPRDIQSHQKALVP